MELTLNMGNRIPPSELDFLLKNYKKTQRPNNNNDLKKIGQNMKIKLKEAGYQVFETGGLFSDLYSHDDQRFIRYKITLKGIRTDLNIATDLYKIKDILGDIEMDIIQYFDSDFFTNLIFWKKLK